MQEIFREYRDSDYEKCEELVNQAWGFDKVFSPKALSDIGKCIYTRGSVLSSNYRMVVEVDGNVVGFIFEATSLPFNYSKTVRMFNLVVYNDWGHSKIIFYLLKSNLN